jgi:hypothetical protein
MKHSSAWLPLVLAALAVTCGCQPTEQITIQRIPKSESGYLANRQTSQFGPAELKSPTGPLTPDQIKDRMLVAVYPLDSAMWFFKLNGTIDQVQSVEPEVLKFFESIEFDNESPKWELPEKWIKGEDRPMRFATLRIGNAEPPVELAISSLPSPQDLLLNINRWRDQMSLPAISRQELDSSTKPLKSKTEKAVLFDVKGRFKGGMLGQNMGAVKRGPVAPATPTKDPIAQPTASVQATAPSGWQPGQTSGMVPIRYQKQSDSGTAQISIIPLPAAANEWEPNVTRWAGEVELQDLTASQLKERTSPVQVDGASGSLVRLIPDVESKAKGTIGVMVKQDDLAWFVKLSGDRKIVAESEETFMEFLKTIKLPSAK